METKPTTAELTSESLVSHNNSGSAHPLSVPDAAAVSTETETISFGNSKLNLDIDTLEVLLCLLSGYMSQMLMGDQVALSFYAAQDIAKKRGQSEEKFIEIANIIFKEVDTARKKHPFVSSGFLG